MLELTLPLLALLAASAAVTQTEPAMPATLATPAEPAASAALPRCSAEVRDRCLQDERFARDVARPVGSRDNNAMAYPTSTTAQRRAGRRN